MANPDPGFGYPLASRDLARVNAELDTWSGCHAIVLGSGGSHRHFRIDLWQEGRETQLAVACVSPDYYCGPLLWADAHIHVTRATEEDTAKYEAEFEVRDDGAAVRLLCSDVQLVEEPAISWRKGTRR
jgi:hypothetical protein